MAYVITSPCVGTCDTACVDVCPTECIHGPIPIEAIRAVLEEERAARFPRMQLYIDPDDCIDCGACIPECPIEAIFHENAVPDEHQADIQRNADFFKERVLSPS